MFKQVIKKKNRAIKLCDLNCMVINVYLTRQFPVKKCEITDSDTINIRLFNNTLAENLKCETGMTYIFVSFVSTKFHKILKIHS